MTELRILIVHIDPKFVAIVSQLSEEIGYEVHALSDARQFQSAYAAIQPHIILYEFILEYCDGIELAQWLIQQNNKARVILTASRMFDVANCAVVLAQAANLFPLSILRCPASPDEIMAALKALARDRRRKDGGPPRGTPERHEESPKSNC